MTADGVRQKHEAKPSDPTRIVPLFPLTGVLLLPGNYLPLNIFEPRYRNLVEDAIEGSRRIGMVQPRVPGADNYGPVPNGAEPRPLYRVGCVGLITRCERQPDGRYLILLLGERRFRLERELSGRRGYRRAVAGFDEFSGDTDPAGGGRQVEGERLLAAALSFAQRFELDFDRDLLASLEPLRLLNVLAAALPFAPLEKQALLEAPTPAARQEALMALMRMTPDDAAGTTHDEAPPLVH